MQRRNLLIAVIALVFVFMVSSQALAAGGHDHSQQIDVPRITVDELKSKMKRGDVVYVMDLRAPGSYNRSPFRIPGDIRFTLPELRTKTKGLPKNAEIATYCTWPDEFSSARGALLLNEVGFTNVRALKGGFDEWLRLGGNVDMK